MDTIRDPESDTEIAFILLLGRTLQRHGVPARQLEHALMRAADRLGLRIEVFATITAMIIAFGPAENTRTSFLRLQPVEVDLGVLAHLDGVVHRFIDGSCDMQQTSLELAQLEQPRPRPALWVRMLVTACGAAGWAVLLRAGLREACAAASVGLLLEALTTLSEGRERFKREFLAVAGVTTAACVSLLAACWPPINREVTVIAVLIPLFPGLALVIAAEELASKDLVTGTARLMSAALVFAQLAFGVALGSQLERWLPSSAPPRAVHWPFYVELGVLLPSIFSLALSMRASWRDLGWFYVAGLIGFVSGRSAHQLFGVEVGAFVGAFAVGVASNAIARHMRRPALLTIVPGVLVLVPGSVSFRSLEALWSAQAVEGLRAAASAMFMSIAIATGLMLASSVMPSRRSL